MSNSVWPHRRQPTRLPRPWDSPGKNTGVGCHFLLQRMTVKSESEVAQSCLTLCYPMNCSPPGSSVHGIFQARVLEWGAIAFSIWELNIYIFSSTCLLLPTHLPLTPSCMCAQSCDPMDCNSPGSSIHGLSQARILEWVAIAYSMRHIYFFSWGTYIFIPTF